jgi:hypothetical protein
VHGQCRRRDAARILCRAPTARGRATNSGYDAAAAVIADFERSNPEPRFEQQPVSRGDIQSGVPVRGRFAANRASQVDLGVQGWSLVDTPQCCRRHLRPVTTAASL